MIAVNDMLKLAIERARRPAMLAAGLPVRRGFGKSDADEAHDL
jgi:hypothetical protein